MADPTSQLVRGAAQEETRERLLVAARRHFAAKGFYGASIAEIARELGFTKQALLYHFKRKEDLYAEVLRSISDDLLALVRAVRRRPDTPERQFEDLFLRLSATVREDQLSARLLVRELLDNRSRADIVRDWYLKPFLDGTVAILREVKGFQDVETPVLFCIVYQLLGSIEYFAISSATLQNMYGEEDYARIREEFPAELLGQIRRLIEGRGGA